MQGLYVFSVMTDRLKDFSYRSDLFVLPVKCNQSVAFGFFLQFNGVDLGVFVLGQRLSHVQLGFV